MEVEEEKKPEEPKKKSKIVKLVSIFLLIGTWGVLIFIATQSELSLVYPLIISILLSLVAVFGLVSNFFIKKFKTLKKTPEGKLPDPINEEELKERVKNILTNPTYLDHIKSFKNILHINIGGNLIYYLQIKPLLNPYLAHIIINGNYPERQPAIFYDTKPTLPEVRNAINKASTNPLKAPDVEKFGAFDPLRQVFIEYEKRTHRKKKPTTTKPKEALA